MASKLDINVPLELSGSLDVARSASFAQSVSASSFTAAGSADIGGALRTQGAAAIHGSLAALGGITTNGADLNLAAGRIFASNIVNGIHAGSNVVISGPANDPTISVSAASAGNSPAPIVFGSTNTGTVTSVSGAGGLTGTVTSLGSISIDFGSANTWNALQTFGAGASATNLTVSDSLTLPGSGIWDSSGNVGIGTTSPDAELSIFAGGDYASHASSTLFSVASSTAGTATSTLFTILSDGSVGIGTTSPGSLLSIGDTNGVNFSVATTTFSTAGGINLAGGCYAVGGACLSAAGLGGLSSVAADYPLTGLGTAASHLALAFGTTTANTWGGIQTFTNGFIANASSTFTSSLHFASLSDGMLAVYNGLVSSYATTTFSAPLSYTSGAVSLAKANASTDGYLASGDWTLFNDKISSSSLSASFPLAYNSGTGAFAFNGLSTSTTATVGNIPYFSGANTFANVATTSVSLGLGLSYSGTLGALVGGAAGTLSVATSSLYAGTTGQLPYFSGTNAITATSSLFLAASGNIGLGTTTPGSLLSVGGVANFTAATSTFYGAGLNLSAGCYAINGVCLSAAGLGGLSSVAADYPITGNGTAASHLALAFGTTTANSWSGLQQFNGGASTTLFSAYGPAYFGATATSSFSSAGVLTLASALTVPNGGTGSTTLSGILVGNGTSQVNTLTLPSFLSLSGSTLSLGTLGIANGGTATSTGGVTNGVEYYNGSTLTNSSNLTFNGSVLTAPNILDNGLTASRLVATDGSKNLTSSITAGNLLSSVTGTTGTAGNLVFSAGPTFTGTAIFANTTNSGTLGVTGLSTFTSGFVSQASSTIVGNGTITGSLTLGTDLSVANGGTGAGTLSTNGVLFGSGTSAIQATAQGGANSILVANAGAPSFSSTPTIGGLTTLAAGYVSQASSTVVGNFTTTGTANALGTITSGIWNGTAIDATHGGTAQTSWTKGDLLYASNANTLAKLAVGVPGTNGILGTSGGVPTWVATSTLGLGNGTFLGLSDTIPSYNANRVLYESSNSVTDNAGFTFNPTTSNLTVSYASTTALTNSGNTYLSGLTTSRFVTTGAGGVLGTSATLGNLISSLSDVSGSTGTSNLVLSASPTLTGTLTAAAANFSGTVNVSGLTASRLVATDGSKNLVSTITSANLAASITDETGTGSAVFATSPTLTIPSVTSGDTGITGTSASSWLALNSDPTGFGTGPSFVLRGSAASGGGNFDFYSGSTRIAQLLANGTGAFVGNITVATTTATSTFSTGGLTVGTSRFVVQQNSGNVGVGSTSPYKTLSVSGDLALTGGLFDSTASEGSNGSILQSTGSGTQWVATSTLGLGNGTFLGLSDTLASYNANRVLFESASDVTDNSGFTFDGTTFTAPNITATGGTVKLTNGTSNTIFYGNTGVAAPGAGSVGEKVQLWGTSGTVSASDYALGIEGSNMWLNTGSGFKWYVSSTGKAMLNGTGLYLGNTTAATNRLDVSGGAAIGSYAGTAAPSNGLIVSGNVGIGTTSPATTLSVAGNTYLTGGLGVGVENTTAGNINFANSTGLGYGSIYNDGGVHIAAENSSNHGLYISAGNPGIDLRATATGANVTSFSTGGGTTYINSIGGNVGIGTTSPATTLSVAGNIYLTGGLGVGVENTAAGTLALAGTSGTSTIAAGQGFTIGSSQFVMQQGSGNVGIGTNNPSSRLSISGPDTSYLTKAVDITNSSGTNLLSVYDDGQVAANYLTTNYAPATGWLDANSSNSAPIFVGFQSGTEKFRFDSQGNLGLGTTSPATTLSVAGNGYLTGGLGVGLVNTVAGTVAVSSQFLGTTADTVSAPSFSWNGDANVGLYHPATDVLGFVTNGAERARIDSSGNVGIGTTTPSSKLAVSGGASIGADFNFAAPPNGLIVEGKVNIGSSGTPGQALDITQPSNTATGINLNQVGITAWRIGMAANDATLRFDPNNNDFSTPKLVLTTGGNVGIGSTSPYALLSLAGTQTNLFAISTSTGAGTEIFNVNSSGNVAISQHNGLTFYPSVTFSPNYATNAEQLLTTTSNLTIGSTGVGGSLTLESGAVAETVSNNGNVGIGSTTPWKTLSVSGDLALTGGLFDSLASAGSNGSILQSTGSATKWVATSTLGLGNGTFLGLSDTLASYNANRVLFESASGVTDNSGFTFDGSVLTAPNILDDGLTASRLVATDGSKNLVSTITSGNLLSSVTGTTGTAGNLVFSVSPTFTTSITSSGVINANATAPAINFGNGWGEAAYTDGNGRFSIYENATGCSSCTYVNSEQANRITLNTDGIDLYGAPSGTAGNSITWTQEANFQPSSDIWLSPRGNSFDFRISSTGSVGIGSSTPAATLSVAGNGYLTGGLGVGLENTAAGTLQTSGLATIGGNVQLSNGTSNTIFYGTSGVAAPGAGSAGEKIQLYGNPAAVEANDYALGIESNNLWFNTNVGFKWYVSSAGTAALTSTGLYLGSTTAATNRLDVSGGAAIGSYAGTAAPSNGLIVSGNVGIGTTSPATSLSVAGNGYLTGGLGVGLLNPTAGTIQTSGLITGGSTLTLSGTSGTSTIAAGQGFTIGGSQFVLQQGSGNVGIGTNTPGSDLTVSNASTATSGSDVYASDIEIWPAPGSASSVWFVGDHAHAVLNTTSSVDHLVAVGGTTDTNAAGTVGTAYGVYGNAMNTTTGATITNAAGGDFNVTDSAGTITNGYGVYVGSVQATNKYSVYASDSTAPSYFAGNVGIGTTSPATTLSVAGNGYLTGGLGVGLLNTAAGTLQTSGAATIGGLTTLAAGYVSQASSTVVGNFTTTGTANALGTITSGIWNGTAIDAIYGGTGQTAVTTGDLLYGSASNTWGRLADVATGDVLTSGGVGVAPSWGKVSLTSAISGVLPVANGGTNNSSAYTAGSVIFSDGTKLTQNNAQFFWDNTNDRLALGTNSISHPSRLYLAGGDASSTPNIVLSTPGATQGERSGFSMYSTFQGTSDNGPRRTADIIAGFNGGAWGHEYLGLDVGNNGSANDGGLLTSEKMRIQSNGNVGIGTTSPATTLSVAGSDYLTGGLGVGVENTTAGTLQTSGDTTVGGNAYIDGGTLTLQPANTGGGRDTGSFAFSPSYS